LERDAIDSGDLARIGAKSLREVVDGDADEAGAQDLNFARAFFTNAMSTAFAYGIGLSTASGTQTFMPFAYDASSIMKSQSKIVR